MSILQALDRPIAFHRIFAQITGSACAGLFLSQAWYWSTRTSDPDGWFWKTGQEWEEETVLTVKQQRAVRKKLVELEILEERSNTWPKKTYYRVNKENLENLIQKQLGQKDRQYVPKGKQKVPKGQTEGAKRANILYTENTSKITSENSGEELIFQEEEKLIQPQPSPIPFPDQPKILETPRKQEEGSGSVRGAAATKTQYRHPCQKENDRWARGSEGKGWRHAPGANGINDGFAKYFAETVMVSWPGYKDSQIIPTVKDAKPAIVKWEMDEVKILKLDAIFSRFKKRQARLSKQSSETCNDPERLRMARAQTQVVKDPTYKAPVVDLTAFGA